MLSFSFFQWLSGAAVALIVWLAGKVGWEKRRNRKLEAEQQAQLDAIRAARLEGIGRMREAYQQHESLPPVRPSRRDDFEKP